jgi:hypothetical protein
MMQRVSEDVFSACDLEAPIEDRRSVECEEFERPFLDAAKLADENGQADHAVVYRLLAAICTFHFKPKDKVEPFSNRVGFSDGSRSLVGSDFDRAQIEALSSIVPNLKNLALKTRVADLVWSRDKARSDCARAAIDGYVGLVSSLIDGTGTERFHEPDPTGVAAESFLERAILIARATGWPKPENDHLRAIIKQVLDAAFARDDMAVARLGRLALDANIEGADDAIRQLSSKSDALIRKPDFYLAEQIQRLLIRVAGRAKDEEQAKVETLKLVAVFEAKADSVDSAMLKTHALQEAIDSLQGLKGVREERQRLHDRLKDAQLHMFEEFGRFEHQIDLTDEVKRLMAGYDGLDLLDCLKRLAFTELPHSPEELIAAAQEEAQQFPLSSLFGASIVDIKGRTVARTGGGIDGEDGLRHKIIQRESIKTGLAVAGAIGPALELITSRYNIGYNILYELCLISPFVPSGSEHAFARGVQAFLYSDEMLATALLVPLLEAGMREMVSWAGRSDTRIDSGGIEEAIGLSALLGEHREVLETVLSPSVVFCIENLFAHELGPKIRHEYCHGLSRDVQFYSHAYVYANKLIFSLMMIPLTGSKWDAIKEHVGRAAGRKVN